MLGNGRPTKLPSTKEYGLMINKEEFRDFYYIHSDAKVCEKFSIKKHNLQKVLDELNIEKKTKEQISAIIRNTIVSKTDEEKKEIQRRKDNTCLEKYGVRNSSMNEEVKKNISVGINNMSDDKKSDRWNKFRNTINNRTDEEKKLFSEHVSNAVHNYFENLSDEKRKEFSDTMSQAYQNLTDEQKENRVKKGIATKKQKYGQDYFSKQFEENKEKIVQTNLEKYNVPFYCMTQKCRSAQGGNASESKPNNTFAQKLKENNIEFEREFRLGNYSYDFKINNILIEINPTVTHNITWSPFNTIPEKEYHFNKSECAKNNSYRCIHIFDWDDIDKIINLLKQRKTVYARNCDIKEIDKNTVQIFLNNYHLQGYVSDDIRLGLFHGDELVSVMTFGKPRYNKNFDYELLRYCSIYNVIGGAEKLFSYFVKNYTVSSVISYCDCAKFDGLVYDKLGFEKKNCSISKHWYNTKTKRHITDNLLRQRGFDQLFNTNYVKGTSNEELMIQNGFVEIYDAGQCRYEYFVK